ncbi:unnamed protein product [Vitrella brassicaformis CCMP3155]|uniref:ATP-dependent Clp protease proteolytic subunit n=2 Tax=Vitrella brassicaformis TaxID=1169539 RepID=A0A0G4FVA4_VITBC|nr:unnamed protein product [Vitrella brassicaformis CCMP3155]|eukprot:CEM18608.1 unnamed protein product [Vitrella brassicaformis CCMP3155]
MQRHEDPADLPGADGMERHLSRHGKEAFPLPQAEITADEMRISDSIARINRLNQRSRQRGIPTSAAARRDKKKRERRLEMQGPPMPTLPDVDDFTIDGRRPGKGAPPVSPPPDLPSMLLHNRIVYLGMPLLPAVTELIVAKLLYLNYESATKPIYMYINSPGSETEQSQSSYETEAFAIADVMAYVRPPIHTIAVGQAWGSAAMLLALGQKGHRYALPNASILLKQPKGRAQGVVSDVAIKARETVNNRRVVTDIVAERTGQSKEQVERDFLRLRYLAPEEAVEYGLVDKVLSSEKELQHLPTFMRELQRFGAVSSDLPLPPARNPQLSPSGSHDLFRVGTT